MVTVLAQVIGWRCHGTEGGAQDAGEAFGGGRLLEGVYLTEGSQMGGGEGGEREIERERERVESGECE